MPTVHLHGVKNGLGLEARGLHRGTGNMTTLGVLCNSD